MKILYKNFLLLPALFLVGCIGNSKSQVDNPKSQIDNLASVDIIDEKVVFDGYDNAKNETYYLYLKFEINNKSKQQLNLDSVEMNFTLIDTTIAQSTKLNVTNDILNQQANSLQINQTNDIHCGASKANRLGTLAVNSNETQTCYRLFKIENYVFSTEIKVVTDYKYHRGFQENNFIIKDEKNYTKALPTEVKAYYDKTETITTDQFKISLVSIRKEFETDGFYSKSNGEYIVVDFQYKNITQSDIEISKYQPILYTSENEKLGSEYVRVSTGFLLSSKPSETIYKYYPSDSSVLTKVLEGETKKFSKAFILKETKNYYYIQFKKYCYKIYEKDIKNSLAEHAK